MKHFILLVVALVVTIQDSTHCLYHGLNIEANTIKSNKLGRNIISDKYLKSPNSQTENHQNSKSMKIEHPFTAEISRYYLKFGTSGFPATIMNLTKEETEEIQKLSLNFVRFLLNSKISQGIPEEDSAPVKWEELNPLITLTHSGLRIEFLNETEKREKDVENITESERIIIWSFLTKYAINVFNEKVKQFKADATLLMPIEEDNLNDSSKFQKFRDTIWRIMKLSVLYAESNFDGWKFSEPETTFKPSAPETSTTKEKDRITTFTYVELPSFKVLPAIENGLRSKDHHGLFYGRGII